MSQRSESFSPLNPVNKREFNELLQGVRELGGALRGNKRVVARVDHIEPDSVVAIRADMSPPISLDTGK